MSLKLHTADLDVIDEKLADKVQQAPGFFKDTPVVLDLSVLEEDYDADSDINASDIIERVRSHKLVPIVVSVMDKSSPIVASIELPLIEGSVKRQSSGDSAKSDDKSDDKTDDKADDKKDSKSDAKSARKPTGLVGGGHKRTNVREPTSAVGSAIVRSRHRSHRYGANWSRCGSRC